MNEKFSNASFSNRKKELLVQYKSGKKVILHYSELAIEEAISTVEIDKETKGKSLKINFLSGKCDYLPYDQPLALSRDPEYLLQNQIEHLVAMINLELRKRGISKKFLSRKLGTSENQIFRLLDPAIINKNLIQLSKVAAILGHEVEITLKVA